MEDRLEYVLRLAGLAASTFAESTGKGLAARLIESGGALSRKGERQFEDAARHGVGVHLRYVNRWSSEVQSFGMSKPEDLDNGTIALDATEVPRRFRPPGQDGREPGAVVGEEDILDGYDHYILLGAPGAGKTTTTKRLARKILTEGPSGDGDAWCLPIVCVMREYPDATSLPSLILDLLGLDAVAQYEGGTRNIDGKIVQSNTYEVVADLLNRSRALILLDGVDEMSNDSRPHFEASIAQLARGLEYAKIIMSCRSGDYLKPIEGFSIIELCDLTEQQVADISRLWLREDAGEFLLEIRNGPPRELASRPLFLGQMIVLYRNMKAIPDQPSSLCRQLVRLMVQDWDQQRGVVRKSQYSRFDVDTKLEFLNTLAYVLLFSLNHKRFSHAILKQAYTSLSSRFGLPSNESEAENVAQELEAHTGIILKSGYESFEFSHLSIQEYLAAEYITRMPRQPKGMLSRAPAIMAVTTALSSDPSKFFGILLSGEESQLDDGTLSSFTHRLLQERPRLRVSPLVGAGSWILIHHMYSAFPFDSDSGPYAGLIEDLVSIPAIKESLVQLLSSHYSVHTLHKLGSMTKLLAKDSSPTIAAEGERIRIAPEVRLSSGQFHHLAALLS